MKPKERLSTEQRRQMIIDAALEIIKSGGWEAVTRESVSNQARIAVGTVNFAFGTMDELRDELMRHAISNSEDPVMLGVIAQGLASGNAVAQSASKKIKGAALQLLM